MILTFGPRWQKNYHALSRDQQKSVESALDLFAEQPSHEMLRNHALKGSAHLRSISAEADIRMIFTEKGGYVEVTLLRVGTHKEVYKK